MPTLLEKIYESHVVQRPRGQAPIIYADRIMMHEVTSPQAFSGLRRTGRKVRRPELVMAVMDHVTPTDNGRTRPVADEQAEAQMAALEKNCADFGIRLYGMGHPLQGVIHVTIPELGFVLPGQTVFCGDSHTTTLGALGALAFGVGTSDVQHLLATQTLCHDLPKQLLVKVAGELGPGVYAKDLILAVIGRLGNGGGNGHVIEYQGRAVAGLDMEGRMTVCNMSVECGAKAGTIAPDQTTFDYLRGRMFAPEGADFEAAVESWRNLASDPDAKFDKTLEIDVSGMGPQCTWGTSPAQECGLSDPLPDPAAMSGEGEAKAAAEALAYMGLKPGGVLEGTPIDVAFIGSCTNGRISDLRAAAEVVRGRKIADGVWGLVVPGSGKVKEQAEAEGLDRVFTEAGFDWRMPGCSMCIAMNADSLKPGQRSASTSNRNFRDRQGRGARTHLVSPATAAASAINGCLSDPRQFTG